MWNYVYICDMIMGKMASAQREAKLPNDSVDEDKYYVEKKKKKKKNLN